MEKTFYCDSESGLNSLFHILSIIFEKENIEFNIFIDSDFQFFDLKVSIKTVLSERERLLINLINQQF